MIFGGGERHNRARGRQRTCRLLTTDHDMREPGGEPMPGIVAHRALLGGNAERIGNAPAGPLVVGRKGNADVAVVEDRIMLAVRLRSEEHTSELQSLIRNSYAVFCL